MSLDQGTYINGNSGNLSINNKVRPVFQFWEKVLSPITILSLGQIKNIKWEKDFFLKNHSYGHSLWFCIKYGTVDKLLRTRLSGASKVHPQSSGDNALLHSKWLWLRFSKFIP